MPIDAEWQAARERLLALADWTHRDGADEDAADIRHAVARADAAGALLEFIRSIVPSTKCEYRGRHCHTHNDNNPCWVEVARDVLARYDTLLSGEK